MSVEQLKIDAIDAAQKYKARYKQTLDPNDLDMFKRFMDVYNHLDGVGGGGVSSIIAGTNITVSPAGGTGDVTISATTALVPDPTGYGSFYSNVSQPITAINTPQAVTLGQTYEAVGTSTSGSRIYMDKAGTYQFSYVAQVANSGNSQEYAEFWIKYNGVEYPNSNTKMILQPRKSSTEPSEQLMTLIINGTSLNDNDYIEVFWEATSTQVSLKYEPATIDYPATPSIIANIIPIGAQGRDSNLNELNDVLITTPSTGQLLRYDNADQRWENWTPNFLTTVPTLDQVTTAGNTTTNAITVGGLTVDTNVLVVDSINDRVGIGTTTPSQSLHVEQGNALIRRTQISTSLFEEGLFLVNPQEPNFFSNTTSPSIVFEGKQKGGAPESTISKARMAFQPSDGVVSIGGAFEIQTWNGTAWTRLVNFSSKGTLILPRNPTGDITEFIGSGTSNVNITQNPSRFVFRPSGPVVGNVGGVTSTLGVNATYQSGNNRGEAAFRVYVTVDGSTNDSLSKFRGVWVDPSINGLAFRDNWRSIEWSNNLGWGLYGVGTANNYLNGSLFIGTTTDAGYKLDVNGTARSNALYVQNGIGDYGVRIGTTSRYGYTPLTVETPAGSLSFGTVAQFTQSRAETTYVADYDKPTITLANVDTTADTWTTIQFSKRGDTASGIAGIGAQYKSSSNSDLAFFTKGSNTFSEKMRITGVGNVGIGTTTPTSKLEVKNGTVIISDTNTGSQINLGIGLITVGRPFIGTNTNTNFLEFGTRGNVYISIVTNSTEKIRITNTGNLLVGTTTNAGYKLDVNGTARVQGVLTTTSDAVINEVNVGRGGGAISSNTRVGVGTLNTNTTGGSNTANGFQALLSNTTGAANTANGFHALYSNTTGGNNTANGRGVLFSNTTGSNNTANGVNALFSNTTGSSNTTNGVNAGRFIADGVTPLTITNNSVFIGTNTRALADNQTNQIVIGDSAIGLGSNTTALGNSSTVTTAIYGNLLLGTTTDAGYKLQVEGEVSANGYWSNSQQGQTIDVPTGAGQTLHFENGILTSVI